MAASPVGVNRRRRFDPENGTATTSSDIVATSDLKGSASSKGRGNGTSSNSNNTTTSPNKIRLMHRFRRLRLNMSSPSGSGMRVKLCGKTLSLTALFFACITVGMGRIIFRQSTKSTFRSGVFVWSTRSYRRPTERELDQLPVALPYGYLDDVRPFFFIRANGDDDDNGKRPSYNHLHFESLQEVSIFARRIHPDDPKGLEDYRTDVLDSVEEEGFSSTFQTDADLEDRHTVGEDYCARNNWKSSQYPNCNTVHELTLDQPPPQAGLERRGDQIYDLRYLGYVLECAILGGGCVDAVVFCCAF
jgi:hypothetical protein